MGALRVIRAVVSTAFGLFWVLIIAFAVLGFPGVPSNAQHFPEPVPGKAVYDPAGAIDPDVERALEAQVDAIEARSGAELAIYVQVDDAATADSNLAAARALLDQWGVGRAGYDDGLVILISFESNLRHGQAHYYAGAGFLRGYLSQSDLQSIFDEVILPSAGQGQIGGGLIEAVNLIDTAVTPEATARLNFLRQVNGVVGIVGAPVSFLLIVGIAFFAWRREGDDPEVLDSPSILMAGPPACPRRWRLWCGRGRRPSTRSTRC